MEPKLSKNKSQASQIEERKNDHIQICIEKDVQAKNITTGFEDVFMIHRALPEINWNEIDLSTSFFNHRFSAPIIVEAMTGGTERAFEINAAIAQAVEELGLGMGVGSQRAVLENSKLERTVSIARKKAPTAFLIANIGGSQIVKEYDLQKVKKAIEMIEADALAIHLNPLQEAVQPEGETNYAGILEKIEMITNALSIPVIVKETGAGIAAEEAKKLKEAGVSCIDVAGAGGTSWAAVEYFRAKQRGELLGQEVAKDLWDWGIPTAISLIEVVQSVDLPVIASGGIRSGKDVAKSLALGAELAGFAFPILEPALKGSEEVKQRIYFILHQLKTVMFIVGAISIKKLKDSPLVIIGRTAEWLEARG
ncbi:MAG: type 2 isopentenyl-diphosphate Delta-isomerase [Candidatus Bathyarchaeia archaeon]